MPEFEILSHTADTGFRATGRSLEDLFIQAARALISIALDPADVQARTPRHVSASGADMEELLVNWLNEVLWLLDGERFVPALFELYPLSQSGSAGGRLTTLAADLHGEPRDDRKHPPRIVVKAATYHQLRIEERNGVWQAEVYLDV